MDDAEKARLAEVFRNPVYQNANLSWSCLPGSTQYIYTLAGDLKRCVHEHWPELEPVFARGHLKRIVLLDFARLCGLYELGGIYADFDYELMSDFTAELKAGAAAVVESEWDDREMQNSLMAAPARHPVIEAFICQSSKTLRLPWFINVWTPGLAGPWPISRVYHRIKMRRAWLKWLLCVTGHCGACLQADLVTKLPCQSYQPRRGSCGGRAGRCCPAVGDLRGDFSGLRAVHWSQLAWGSAEANEKETDRQGVPVGYACRAASR